MDTDDVIPDQRTVNEKLLPQMGQNDTVCLTYGSIELCNLRSIQFNFLLLKGLDSSGPVSKFSHSILNLG